VRQHGNWSMGIARGRMTGGSQRKKFAQRIDCVAKKGRRAVPPNSSTAGWISRLCSRAILKYVSLTLDPF
jgi:hypothetical protein